MATAKQQSKFSENVIGLEQSGGLMEKQLRKVPSETFLWLAGGSIFLISLILRLSGRPSQSFFVGQWAPTFLILGVFDKLTQSESSTQGESK